ncbi:uncharacterized protein LOC129248706 [Anastrepha obliqua]|uniref:uncharacterized protein LOC129248706 n=1 Tax=Anastrepha obliqua TaxID=95512 RepID=UPI002409892E|nr:uncharacterized protein LOC129248706 [Anastrepha obliqua]
MYRVVINQRDFVSIFKYIRIHQFEFKQTNFLRREKVYDKTDLPIEFKVSPESLLHLAARIVDALPLPDVYQWTNEDVCKWLERYGYKQYEHTFRVNMITGRQLLLIDADALCAMNIKKFNDIKHLLYGIRKLFYFELTNFMRSISLPSQRYHELYKLFLVRSGCKQLKRSDLLCQLQVLRGKPKYLLHWDVLEHWMSLISEPLYQE